MFECVRGTDKDNTEQVLYLFMADAYFGMQWVAAHAPPATSWSDVVIKGTQVIGSADEGIWLAGNHEWHWHRCML